MLLTEYNFKVKTALEELMLKIQNIVIKKGGIKKEEGFCFGSPTTKNRRANGFYTKN